MLEDDPDLPVLALPQADIEPDVGPFLRIDMRLDRAIAQAVDGDAGFQPRQRCVIDLTEGAHPIAAQPAGRRQGDPARKFAVIGQQQKTLGGHVETANGDDAAQSRRKVIEDGGTAPRIAMGCQDPGRLVVAPQPRRLDRWQRLAVDGNNVRRDRRSAPEC